MPFEQSATKWLPWITGGKSFSDTTLAVNPTQLPLHSVTSHHPQTVSCPTYQHGEVVCVGLDVVKILWLHLVKALELDSGQGPHSVHEGAHPLNAGRYTVPCHSCKIKHDSVTQYKAEVRSNTSLLESSTVGILLIYWKIQNHSNSDIDVIYVII